MSDSYDSGRQVVACQASRCRVVLFLWPGLLLLLLGFAGQVKAEWTGVAFDIYDTRSDWEFSEGTRETKISGINLLIEERTASGLSVGASLGYMTIRIDGNDTVETKKFDGENLEIYLRQDLSISESLALEFLFNYGFYAGDENTSSDDRDDINWNQLGLEFGASFQRANFRFTPFVSYTDIDGDISGDDPTETFTLADEIGYGVRLDFFTESTAFIRVELLTGSYDGGYLSFVRRY